MGRHAGWIALHSGIAGGGDAVLIPEIGWDWDNVCRKILERDNNGKKFTLVVVAEGAKLPAGGLVGESRSDCQAARALGVSFGDCPAQGNPFIEPAAEKAKAPPPVVATRSTSNQEQPNCLPNPHHYFADPFSFGMAVCE